ncbi:MAG: ATP-binding cassette domain-containing protein [Candidatus Heimdallarchaeaceae archaeon]
MNKPIISFQNFGFKYHLRDDWVLAHINININAGEFIVFSGPNGSGKSTICYSLLGLIPHFYSGLFLFSALIFSTLPYQK